MTSIGSPSPLFFGGKKAYEIERSLRFNGSDDPYLARTITTTGNRKTFTFSGWVKRSNITTSAVVRIFNCNITTNPGGTPGQEVTQLGFYTDDTIYFAAEDSSDNGYGATSAKYRDPSAWMHLLYVVDTTESAAADRIKLFVNGVQQTLTFTTNVALNADTQTNLAGAVMTLGAIYFNGVLYKNSPFYLAEANFIDGQALTPSSFTETDVRTGQLIPKKYDGTYGTNGFYLNFLDNSGTTATTLGKDSSGNGNNFTPYNFSVAAGVGNDSLEDTPTNNFCTLNPLSLIGAGGTISNGNLDFTSDSNYSTRAANFPLKTGKWYWECTPVSTPSNAAPMAFGIVRNTNFPIGGNSYLGYDPNGNVAGFGYFDGGNIKGAAGDGSTSGANLATGQTTYTQNDVIGLASDIPNGTLAFYKNGTLVYTITGINSHEWFPAISGYGTGSVSSSNFGQRPFVHTPPTGHQALCSANLPEPVINFPNKHFDTVLYTGDGNATGSQTNVLEFQPDWLWSKPRTAAYVHLFYDSVRGAGNSKALNTGGGSNPGTGAEGAAADNATYGFLNSFDANGFSYTRGSATTTYFNQSGINYAVWNWNAGDTDGKTYTVKVHNFSGNNRYIFDDFQTEAVTLDLAEGGTYIFNMDDASNASHPFSIGTAANGTVYTSGITYFLDGVSKTYSEYTSGFAAATTRRLHITVPASAPVLYYWCSVHSGMGGQINTNSTLGSSNFDGDLQSTAKVNSTAGFSIVKWTSGANAYKTVGHGLGVKPDIVILKSVSIAAGWFVYYDVVDGTNDYLSLNTSGASLNAESYSIVPPTSSVFGTDGAFVLGATNVTMIAYVFSSVEGYSKIGSYKGNGSTDGPFVFTGFRPAWVMIKISSTTENWTIFDNKRSEFNLSQLGLYANLTSAEVNISTNGIDILSNGFKLRGTGSRTNKNNGTFIYLAFAESPFKYARAR